MYGLKLQAILHFIQRVINSLYANVTVNLKECVQLTGFMNLVFLTLSRNKTDT